jgi:hypothetical protein
LCLDQAREVNGAKRAIWKLGRKRLKIGDLVLWKNYRSDKLGIIVGFDIKVLEGDRFRSPELFLQMGALAKQKFLQLI